MSAPLDGPVDQVVRHLLDRAQIEDVVRTYAASVDLGDFDRLVDVFHHDVTTDYGPVASHRGRDELIRWLSSHTAQLKYQHHLVVPYLIEIAGDGASCLVYLVSHQRTADDAVRMMNSRYTLSFVRVPGARLGWQINHLRLEIGIDETRP